MSPPTVSDLLDNAEVATRNLLELLDAAREANEALVAENKSYKRKCKALMIAVEKLKSERQKDRSTVELWREKLKEVGFAKEAESSKRSKSPEVVKFEPEEGTDGSTCDSEKLTTQDSSDCIESETQERESPDISHHFAEYDNGLGEFPHDIADSNQRVLPLSLAVSSLPLNSADNAADVIASSPPSQQIPPSQNTLEENVIFQEFKNRKRVKESLCLQRREWLQSLVEQEWHPADFKMKGDPEDTENVNSQPFHCPLGNCGNCIRSIQLLDRLGSIVAETTGENDFACEQNTPSGFWRADFPDSSQIQKIQAENREKTRFEGRQRLAKTLWKGPFIFCDPTLNQEARLLMR